MDAIISHQPPRVGELERTALRKYFENTWQLYEQLFWAVNREDAMYEAPDPLRHPLIFYLGHTAAFYVNKLAAVGLIEHRVDRTLESLMAKGVDPEQPGELAGFRNWPNLDRVVRFRQDVFELVQRVIDKVELPAASHDSIVDRPIWALLMSLEHERIHFETSSVLIRQLDVVHTRRPAGWTYAPSRGQPEPARFIDVPDGYVRLGRPRLDMYAWDNELGRLDVHVAGFVAADRLVTNAEFRTFVERGGYHERAFWSPAGWAWRNEVEASAPRFWRKGDGGWRYRAMFDELPLPLDWPAEVNAHEAHAYCQFVGSGYRLPTEAEYRRMTDGAPVVHDDSVYADCYNLNLAYGSPTPVDFCHESVGELGFYDPYGNVWQWLSDDFKPLPGFQPHPLYRDFSDPYFDDQHATLLGGSWASTGESASRYYRLWFRRKFYQHAGFRLVRSAAS